MTRWLFEATDFFLTTRRNDFLTDDFTIVNEEIKKLLQQSSGKKKRFESHKKKNRDNARFQGYKLMIIIMLVQLNQRPALLLLVDRLMIRVPFVLYHRYELHT